MSELIAVIGDEEDHLQGALTASNNTGKLFAQGKRVVYHDSTAAADGALHTVPAVNADTCSTKVFSEGIPVHRNNDQRYCGAKTIVTNQTKVFAG